MKIDYAPGNMFQFPSNGKVLLDWVRHLPLILSRGSGVSIPFKRESPFGRPLTVRKIPPLKTCFNSLQTGKSFWTRLDASRLKSPWQDEVSIPFKRESPFGRSWTALTKYCFTEVSIPFKRESPFGLGRSWGSGSQSVRNSFNSLQTGKSFWT